MIKKLIATLIFFMALQAQAFEDYIITTNGKLTDISIEDNTIVNVYPLITIMNDKNTLIVSPLKTGKTSFSVLKNNKERFVFNIEVDETNTKIDDVKGFEIIAIDEPDNEEFELDKPPTLKEVK